MIRVALVALVAAGCAPKLPRMTSPQPCCSSPDEVRRLDRQWVMIEGIYSAAGIETEAGVITLAGPRPAEELARLEGRHVVVYGRLRARSVGGAIDEIERIDVH